MKIGVLADTHIPSKAKKLPEKMLRDFKNVDLIIHAGDIVSQSVLDQLADIAPVKAVYGNVDPPELRKKLKSRLKLEIQGYKIGVLHGHNLQGHIMEKIGYVFPDADIIIFGHIHHPINKKVEGQLIFNPGSPTDRRLQPYHTYGIITLGEKIKSEIITIKR